MAVTSYFSNSSLDYKVGKNGATIWAFSKNVALIFDSPFAFKIPSSLKTSNYSFYVITKIVDPATLRGVMVYPSYSSATITIKKDTVGLYEYNSYELGKFETDTTYLIDSTGIKKDGVECYGNPAVLAGNDPIIGMVFRFETEYSRLDFPDFKLEDVINIYDLKLNTSTSTLSYKAESFFMGNNISHYLELDGIRQAISPTLTSGVYSYVLGSMSDGLHKINIIGDSGYTTQTSRTVYLKKGEEVITADDKSTSIVLYKSSDKDYSTNGEGILRDIISAKVTETLNSVFNLELEISTTDRLANEISVGCVIKCPVSKGKNRQLFKVRTVTRTVKQVIVFAQHIAIAKLSGNYIVNEYQLTTNAVTAVDEVMSNTIIPTEISIDGSIFGDNKLVSIKKGKVIDVLINNTDSIKNTFNCDFEFDNFTLRVHEKRGKESQNVLRDKKNIIEIEEDISDLDICTVLIPYSSDGITIPELTVTSPNMNAYDDLYCMEYTFQDIKIDEIYDTEGKVQAALKQACTNLFNTDKIDIPIFSYRADVEEIESKFEDTLEIGDEIPCYHKKLGLNLIGRIIERNFDALKMKNTSFNINFRKKSLNDILSSKSINETIKSKRDFATKKYVEDLVKEISDEGEANVVTTSSAIESLSEENLELTESAVEMDYRLSALELEK